MTSSLTWNTLPYNLGSLIIQLTGETDSESDDDSELAQTLYEVDYETVIDDADVVDEFLLFKTTLQC